VDEFELTSPAFEHGQRIPRKYTCEGEDVSPAELTTPICRDVMPVRQFASRFGR